MDDQDRNGKVYISTRKDFQEVGNYYRMAIEYREKRLKTVTECGDLAAEVNVNEYLGNAYQSLGDYRKGIEYHDKHMKNTMEVGNRGGEGRAYGLSLIHI